jgi:hypothetical protein
LEKNERDFKVILTLSFVDHATFAPKTTAIYFFDDKIYHNTLSFSREQVEDLKAFGVEIEDNYLDTLVLESHTEYTKEVTRSYLESCSKNKLITPEQLQSITSLLRRYKIDNILDE